MVELISIHIGKTAGMSFRQVLTDVYRDEHMLWDYAPYKYEKADMLPSSVKAIHGHISIRKYQGHFENAKRITWLRHPLFRLFSEYHFAKKYKDQYNPLARKLIQENLTFEQYIEEDRARNVMSKQISGLDIKDFFFVGIQEFYGEELAYFSKKMDWEFKGTERKNVNTDSSYRKALVALYRNDSLLNRIADLNAQDFELYQQALHLRAKRTGVSSIRQQTMAMCQRTANLLQ